MRLFSAFISSLVFASAVLEHPKLFVHADTYLAPTDWAGIRMRAKGYNGETSVKQVSANFQVPQFWGTPHDSAFLGVSLSNSQDRCTSKDYLSISAGILMGVKHDGTLAYKFAVQFYPNGMHFYPSGQSSSETGEFSISVGDPISAQVELLDDYYSVKVQIQNHSRNHPWSYSADGNIGYHHWHNCPFFAEWKIGGIKASAITNNGVLLYPTRFEPDTLPLYIDILGLYITAANQRIIADFPQIGQNSISFEDCSIY